MPQVLDKWIKYVGNEVDIWKKAKIFGKRLRYMGHGLSI